MGAIELVTHCWSGDDVPIYHHLLALQLRSVLTHRASDVKVKVTVCYTPGDTRTAGVLADYAPEFSGNPSLSGLPLPPGKLFRRAIGRNVAAKRTDADVVWFTDVDYLFGEGALQAAHGVCVASEGTPLVHPKYVWLNQHHTLGDMIISNAAAGQVEMPPKKLFFRRREQIAIGGIQIVQGDYCREHGYLSKKRKWQEPVELDHFDRCYCDIRFRKNVGSAKPVRVPEVYRIRHSRCGRDQGVVDHAELAVRKAK